MNRIALLAQHLDEQAIDAFFAHTPVSMGYLSGFWEDGHERFLTLAIHKSGQYRLICPALSAIQAKRIGIEDIRAWKDGENPVDLFETLCDDWDLHSGVIAVDDFMPAKMLIEMQSILYAALFKPGGEVIAELQSQKDEREIELLKMSASIADQTYEEAKRAVREGITELELQEVIEQSMRRLGGDPQSCSVCFGANGAESHHINDSTPLQRNQVVLIDFGCKYQGYVSDITRVFSFGSPTSELEKLYEIVYRAHEAAREKVAIGVRPCDVDTAARTVIEQAGYGEFFTHRTGHGVGLQVHESPYISSSNEMPLKENQCFSIEPGIYLEGVGGVRLENLYYSSPAGAISFNAPISPVLEQV
jgi:Xaa-Pro dipeptidase